VEKKKRPAKSHSERRRRREKKKHTPKLSVTKKGQDVKYKVGDQNDKETSLAQGRKPRTRKNRKMQKCAGDGQNIKIVFLP